MKKYFCYGFSVLSLVVAVAMLAGTHTAVSVASCDYCKVKTVAEAQSDSLDKIAVAEVARSEMIVADSKIHIDKIKADAVIAASFTGSEEKVADYVRKKTTDNLTDNDDIAFDAELFSRFDQTRSSYELASNTLISNDPASVGSRQASRYGQSATWLSCATVTEAASDGGEFVCASCRRSEDSTIPV